DESSPRDLDQAAFTAEIAQRYGERADAFFAAYPEAPREALRQEAADRGLLGLADWASRPSAHSRRLYLFSHVEPGPRSGTFGAFHSSELPYVFDTLDRSPGRAFTDLDHAIADATNAAWASFVTTGNPNASGLPAWPAFDSSTPAALEIAGTA